MKDDLMQFLMDFTWNHHIGLDIGMYDKSFRSRALPEYRLIIINTNWHNSNEVPFSFAHEIGHIMNGDTGIRYYVSSTIRDKSEYQANLYGIGLLIDFCKSRDYEFDNAYNFCECFGIPASLEYIASLKLRGIM